MYSKEDVRARLAGMLADLWVDNASEEELKTYVYDRLASENYSLGIAELLNRIVELSKEEV